MFSDENSFMNSWLKPASQDAVQISPASQAANLYAIPPDLLNGIIANNNIPFYTMTLDLGTAQVDGLEIPVQGTSVVIRGYQSGSNTFAVDTSVFVGMQLERYSPSNPIMPLKHNFGFRGPFSKIYLTWPQQLNAGVSRMATLIIYKGMFAPWIDGSAAT